MIFTHLGRGYLVHFSLLEISVRLLNIRLIPALVALWNWMFLLVNKNRATWRGLKKILTRIVLFTQISGSGSRQFHLRVFQTLQHSSRHITHQSIAK
jgi:hypothetical protein